MARVSPPDLRVEALGAGHDRAGFSCGNRSIDSYLRTQASQDVRRKATAVFVLVSPAAPARVLGFFTLSAFALEQGEVPPAARKHLPRYPRVSATLIGRLAVATDCQGQGLGRLLLAGALRKAFESADSVGSSMVVVDAIDDAATAFYAAHGFVRLPDSMPLVLPMRTIGTLITR